MEGMGGKLGWGEAKATNVAGRIEKRKRKRKRKDWTDRKRCVSGRVSQSDLVNFGGKTKRQDRQMITAASGSRMIGIEEKRTLRKQGKKERKNKKAKMIPH